MADDNNKAPDEMSSFGLGGFIKKDVNGNATDAMSAENGNAADNPPPTDGTGAQPSTEPAAGFKRGSGSAFSMPIGRPDDEPKKSNSEELSPDKSVEKSDKKFFFAGDELQTGFIYILKATFKTFFKKFWVFLGVALLNILLVGGAMFAMVPLMFMLMMSGDSTFVMIIPLLVPVLLGLVSFFFYGTIANQAHSAYNDLNIKARQSFGRTVRLTGKAIVLALRIFVYSGLWLIIVLMLIFAVMNTFFSGMGSAVMGNLTAIAEDNEIIAQVQPLMELVTPAETVSQAEVVTPLETDVPAVSMEDSSVGFLSGEDQSSITEQPIGILGATSLTSKNAADSINVMFLLIANFAIGVAVFIIVIIAMIRMIYASMAFPILMASPEHSAQEVLDRSREITKKKWWLIVCFMTIFPLIIALPGVVLNLLNVFVFRGDATFSLVSTIIGALVVLLAYPLTVTFYQILAQELANPERRLKLNGGLLLLTLLIFFSPLLLAAGSVFLLGNMMSGESSLMNSFINKYQPPAMEETDFSITDSSKIDFDGSQESVDSNPDADTSATPTKPKVKRT